MVLIIINLFFNSLELGLYKNFSTQLTIDIVYLMFETNKNEALEFLMSYLNKKIFIIFGYWILGSIIFIITKNSKKKSLKLFLLILIITFFSAISVVKITLPDKTEVFKDKHVLVNIYKGIKRYNKEMKTLEKFKENSDKKLEKLNVFTNKNEAIYVMVIGQSFNRNHSSLYGYQRQTQPLLENEKNNDSLFVFNDVVSPHHVTTISIKKLITTISHDNKESLADTTVLFDILKKSGFKTYWISNQKSYAIRGTGISPALERNDSVSYTDVAESKVEGKFLDGEILPNFR